MVNYEYLRGRRRTIDRIAKVPITNGLYRYPLIEIDDTPARPAAISSWAPYGMNPCTRHENVSMMLAALRGSIPNFSAISRQICPVVMIADRKSVV